MKPKTLKTQHPKYPRPKKPHDPKKSNNQRVGEHLFEQLWHTHSQKKAIELMASINEWGLWNNSWVKNLLVRPLAPGRKTPGQLHPTFNDLPGWAILIPKIS